MAKKQTPPAARLSDPQAIDLVTQLMAIPGRSGEEGLVAQFIRLKLREAGVPDDAVRQDTANKRSPLGGDIGNLIVKLPGVGPRRMLSAHLDTVPICVGCKPRRKGPVIVSADPKTGLGGDNRAGCAVLLAAAMDIARSPLPHPPLTFLWTVQEEAGLHGARNLSTGLLGRPRLAFNFDGGSPAKLTIGATGGYRMTIEVTGLASHAGNAPQQGVSAIAIASLAIADLTRKGWHGLVKKGRKQGASNVGVIHGGEATNVVTDRVTLRAEARSHDAAFLERIVAEIKQAFDHAVAEVRSESGQTGNVEFRGQLDYAAFRLPANDPSVAAAGGAIRAVGREPEIAVTNGGLDANWLTARGVPTVTLGCGQRSIHTVSEQLDIAEFLLARAIAFRLAQGESAAPQAG
ncbi:M20/M25/M40 family metallo-hydrolase [Pirellulimonas nuda]|uniref:M20/M25/M40 family metallo-hydrolase n=1 Tax=Pirellulimonas nuda TaxID=2528009 RepID=UPI001E5B0ABE|nr:M20/M25/M40 family metallo-hydrolase [Pirellulimonas nuda]